LEVELKFALDPQVRQRIANLPGIRLINQKKFVDTYYDVQGYKLSTSDIWFRNRAKAWEIKIPTTFTSGNHDPNNNVRDYCIV
jgi:adenylate cyclase class IV